MNAIRAAQIIEAAITEFDEGRAGRTDLTIIVKNTLDELESTAYSEGLKYADDLEESEYYDGEPDYDDEDDEFEIEFLDEEEGQ